MGGYPGGNQETGSLLVLLKNPTPPPAAMTALPGPPTSPPMPGRADSLLSATPASWRVVAKKRPLVLHAASAKFHASIQIRPANQSKARINKSMMKRW